MTSVLLRKEEETQQQTYERKAPFHNRGQETKVPQLQAKECQKIAGKVLRRI